MKYYIDYRFIVAGRIQPNDVIEDDERPRFGFYWWFFIPNFNSNGGRFGQDECVYFSLNFLCFSFGLTFYPKLKNNKR